MHDKILKFVKLSELLQFDSKEMKFFTASGMSAIRMVFNVTHTDTHTHKSVQIRSEDTS